MSYQIDQDGTIIRDNTPEENNRGGNSALVTVLVLLLLTASGFAIGLGVKKSELNDSNIYLRNELSALEDSYREVNNVKNEIKNDFNRYVRKYSPIIVETVEVGNADKNGNMETDYGRSIYSYRTMYLKPRIKYTGYKSENISLKIKLYDPYNNLATGSSSPKGYSYTTNVYVYEGVGTASLSGWGSSYKGHWSAGQYRFEIWYEDVCIAVKSFTVY